MPIIRTYHTPNSIMIAIRHYVWAGEVEMVERMIAVGCDVNHIDNNGCTYLWIGRRGN